MAGSVLALTGCGMSSGERPDVTLSLVAPTDGATVKVRTIVVLGHVSPGNARVLVAGRWARVRRGTFRVRMRLPLVVNHIGVLAAAQGFRPASLKATVRVSRSAAARHRGADAPPPSLPSNFGTRAEAICSGADQQMLGLHPTPQTFVADWRQLTAIRDGEDRQLVDLAGPAASLPAVRTFIHDLRVKAASDEAFFSDIVHGRREAAIRISKRGIVLAPQWWEHAGRLGAPDCGAVTVPAGPVIDAYTR